jgi:DNA-directed RNA polymerase subunit RPC12/RpoP
VDTKDYKYCGIGLEGIPFRTAHLKFENYRDHYHLTQYSDLQLLEDLVYREYLMDECKKKIAKAEEKYKKEDKEATAPKYLVDGMDSNLEQIMAIKERLGMFSDKTKDGYDEIQTLKEKFKIWMEENQASRYLKCPHCSKSIMLKIKTDAWEAQKHPMFKDNTLYNKKLVELFIAGRLTAKEVAEILEVSDYYVTWLVEKWHQRKDKECQP